MGASLTTLVSSFGRATAWPIVVLLAALGSVGLLLQPTAQAVELAYSFETNTDGFVPNSDSGTGITVTQDTIGATDGTGSLKVDIDAGETFVGALVGVDDFAPSIGNPPGLDYFLVDLTLTEAYTGVFADLGVLLFGTDPADAREGQVQFIEDRVAIGSLEAGTYQNVLFDLTRGNFQPFTFEFPISFNDAVLGNGADDLVPTGLQFYINTDGDPITVYFDNIRTGQIFEADYNGDGTVDAGDYIIWRDNFSVEEPITSGASFFEGDGDQDGDVDMDDYDFWAARYGLTVPPAALGVPEPATAWLLAVVAGLVPNRQRRA